MFVDGDFYYITQTIDECESSERLEFQFLAPEPTITIEDAVLCLGQSTTVSVSAAPAVA